MPFGSALKRRSRTTYRPTVTPEGSTHVDTAFTGTTSSFSRTASRKVAVVAVVRQRVFAQAPWPLPQLSANSPQAVARSGPKGSLPRAGEPSWTFPTGPALVAMDACYAPLLLWGPLLVVVTISYYRRRRVD